MSWGLIFLAAFLAVCLLAGPAAAGIKSFTDSQGVIRITNIAPAKQRQIPAEPPVAAPVVPKTPREVTAGPKSTPPEVTPAPSPPGEQAGTTPIPAKSPPEAAPEPLETVAIDDPAPNNQETVRPPEAAAPAGPLPVRRVAYEPDNPGAGLSPGTNSESRQSPHIVTAGGIHRFRNHRGILVITNVKPAAPQAAPSIQQAASPSSPGNIPGKESDRNLAYPGAPGLRPVAWSPDQPRSAPLPAANAAAGLTAPAAPGSIRRYRDKNGVIHIENLGTAPEKPSDPPPALAQAGPQTAGQPASEPNLPEKPPEPKLAALPEPGPPEQAAPIRVLTAAAAAQAEVPVQGNIRRYRDRLGIWRIASADDHWLLEAPPQPRPAASPRQVLMAAVQAAARLPVAPAVVDLPVIPAAPRIPEPVLTPDLTIQARLATPRGQGEITAVRDSRGRLVITNIPSRQVMGRGQSWMVARAQLEPIIQEAARAYRLPPALVRAVIKVESNFHNAAVSPKGAMGLMQLMPGTAADLGVEEPFNPWQNIHGGCRYLRILIDSFGGSLPLALAGYNAGPQRVVDSGYKVPDIKETQNFLDQVLQWYFTEERRAGRPWT